MTNNSSTHDLTITHLRAVTNDRNKTLVTLPAPMFIYKDAQAIPDLSNDEPSHVELCEIFNNIFNAVRTNNHYALNNNSESFLASVTGLGYFRTILGIDKLLEAFPVVKYTKISHTYYNKDILYVSTDTDYMMICKDPDIAGKLRKMRGL